MSKNTFRKAAWIAEELEESVDDVYDVLLGNITSPWELYSSVNSLSLEYDRLFEEVIKKDVTRY